MADAHAHADQAVDPTHDYHAHIVPIPILLSVFALLVVLTVVTYAVTFIDLGAMNIWIALLIAALRFLVRIEYDGPVTTPKLSIALPAGAALGFISGLTGIGGGIYLSPLLLLMRWTTMRTNAAIAAAFILVNSIAGLTGHMTTAVSWPSGIPLLAAIALIGAFIGSELAVRRLSPVMLIKVLGVVLLIAGIKMIMTA